MLLSFPVAATHGSEGCSPAPALSVLSSRSVRGPFESRTGCAEKRCDFVQGLTEVRCSSHFARLLGDFFSVNREVRKEDNVLSEPPPLPTHTFWNSLDCALKVTTAGAEPLGRASGFMQTEVVRLRNPRGGKSAHLVPSIV